MKFLPAPAPCALPLLALIVATKVRPADPAALFHVVAYHQNVSESVLEEMDNRSSTTMEYLYQFLENCTMVDAGTLVAGRERHLELENEEGEDPEATGELQETDMDRELFGSCPPACSNSGSTTCRALGCAYCGRCRRRRRGRKLQGTVPATLVGTGGSPASAYPLGLCQADCDTDNQCQAGLRCWRRNTGQPLPSPCTGRSTDNSDDYCVPAPADAVTASYTGNNGSPVSAFPLGVCQGDCDSNSECGPGLVCHQRNAGDPLPYPCWGGSVVQSENWDFCVPAPKPPTKAPTKRPTRSPTKTPTKAPTKAPTNAPTNDPTSKPTLEVYTDEEFEDFLRSPNMTALKIEQRLDRHANFLYCAIPNAPETGCRIYYKILHILENGTTYALTGPPTD